MEREKSFINLLKTIVFYLFVYGTMLIRHYSADSFTYTINPEYNNRGNLSLGRFGAYLVNQIVIKLGGNYVEQQVVFVIILILTLSITTEILYLYYLKLSYKLEGIQKKLLKMAIILMFCNVFIMEWFIFVEMTFIWSLSLIFMVLGVIQINKQFTIKKMIASMLCVTISVSFYQATMGYYVFFSLIAIYIVNKGELNRKAIFDSIKVILCGAVGGCSNLLFIKAMQLLGLAQATGRTETMSFKMLLENIHNVWKNVWTWTSNSHGLLPQNCILITGIMIYVIFIIYLVKVRMCKKNVLYIVCLIVICNGMVYFPHFLTSTIWMAQRTIAGFFVLISLPIIIIAEKDTVIERIKICTIIVILVLGINIWKINDISVNVVASNRIDEEIAYQIQERITDYEKKTNNKIDTISICKDANTMWGNKTIRYICMDTNIRVYNVAHGGVDCINYYNGTNYKSMNTPESVYTKNFANKDWQVLNLNEQLIFEDNVAYLATY